MRSTSFDSQAGGDGAGAVDSARLKRTAHAAETQSGQRERVVAALPGAPGQVSVASVSFKSLEAAGGVSVEQYRNLEEHYSEL